MTNKMWMDGVQWKSNRAAVSVKAGSKSGQSIKEWKTQCRPSSTISNAPSEKKKTQCENDPVVWYQWYDGCGKQVPNRVSEWSAWKTMVKSVWTFKITQIVSTNQDKRKGAKEAVRGIKATPAKIRPCWFTLKILHLFMRCVGFRLPAITRLSGQVT